MSDNSSESKFRLPSLAKSMNYFNVFFLFNPFMTSGTYASHFTFSRFTTKGTNITHFWSVLPSTGSLRYCLKPSQTCSHQTAVFCWKLLDTVQVSDRSCEEFCIFFDFYLINKQDKENNRIYCVSYIYLLCFLDFQFKKYFIDLITGF
jgi:hypothetical protein